MNEENTAEMHEQIVGILVEELRHLPDAEDRITRIADAILKLPAIRVGYAMFEDIVAETNSR